MIYLLLILFFSHWVGDFVCQTRYIADNKSKKTAILFLHVTIYMAVMSGVVLLLVLFNAPDGFSREAYLKRWLQWTVLNFGLHFCTDAVTSRLTGYWYRSGNIKAFFTTVGFDQFLHAAALLLTTRDILMWPWWD